MDIAISFVFWSLVQVLFYFVPNVAAYKMPLKTELDFRNRIVSFFHGLSALVLTSYQVFFVPYSCGDAVS